MSICQQAKSRRSRARLNRPKGLRAVTRGTKSLDNFAGKISKTAKKSGGK